MFFCTFFAQVYCNACSCIIVFFKTLLKKVLTACLSISGVDKLFLCCGSLHRAGQFLPRMLAEAKRVHWFSRTHRAANMMCRHHLCINMYTTHMYLCMCFYIYIYIHRHPAGPETVLVKPHFFIKMRVETTISAVMRTFNFGSIFWTFSRFTTVPAHFLRLM